MKIDIEERGLRRAAFFMRRIAQNAKNLYPLANKARERWHESEQRTFAANARWAPRKASTVKRYRWPIKTLNGYRKGRAQGRGTGFYTGGLHKALTKPFQPGIRDDVHIGRGKLTVDFGIKGGRQPRAYGQWFNDGAGARPPRQVVGMDEQALRALAGDTSAHILPRGDGR